MNSVQQRDLARLVGGQPGEQRRDTVDGVVAEPRPRRMGPPPRHRHFHAHCPLTTRFDPARGRLQQHCEVRREPVGVGRGNRVLGGDIRAESTFGIGSCFTVTLPDIHAP